MMRYWPALTVFSLVAGGLATPALGADGASESVSSSTEAILFYLMAGVAAFSAIGCVFAMSIVRMAVCLFGALGSVAMLYFLMAASFLGAIQLIVYAGGTLIVIVFGIMLTSPTFRMRFTPKRIEVAAGAALSLILFAALASILTGADWSGSQPDDDGFTVAEFGNALLTDYLVPFEIASVLLLAVMIGAAYLSWQERE